MRRTAHFGLEDMNHTTATSITVTSQDHQRLYALATSKAARSSETFEALAHELERAHVVEAAEIPAHVVTMHSRVVIRDQAIDRDQIYTLVYPGEEDIAIGHISILTPLGAALIGLSEGQTLSWTTRDGRTKELTVRSILYQPEADGRFDL